MSLKIYFKNLVKYIRTGGSWDGAPVVKMSVSYSMPNERFKDKKVLVTGGGTGIGLAIANAFLAEGAEVLIVGRRASVLDNVKKTVNNEKLHTMVWDIADIPNIKTNFETALKEMSGFDIFINNAGVFEIVNYASCPEETYDKIVNINTKALYYLISEETKHFIGTKMNGHIINISSIDGIFAYTNPYSISKWGVNCITRSFAKELIPHGVTVNAIAPGAVITDILHDEHRRNVMDDAYNSQNPSGRYTLVEEIAALALFLSSGSACNINGQIIAVDGGKTIL